jgi:putative transposase
MAAYIDLNPVRAGIVEDPKDDCFCGYAEAVAGVVVAKRGLAAVWRDHGARRSDAALRAHRSLIFGKRASELGLTEMTRQRALKVLEQDGGYLPKAVMLRCRVRYFTDGAILGTAAFVRGFTRAWQVGNRRKHSPKVSAIKGSDWARIAVIQGLRRQIFS